MAGIHVVPYLIGAPAWTVAAILAGVLCVRSERAVTGILMLLWALLAAALATFNWMTLFGFLPR